MAECAAQTHARLYIKSSLPPMYRTVSRAILFQLSLE